MIQLQKHEQLRLKALSLKDKAVKQYNELIERANQLEKMANLLQENRNDLKQSRITAIELVATEIENEWLAERLQERKLMKQRGENVTVPETIELLKQELTSSN